MILYSPDKNARIHYMADWLGHYLFDKPITAISSDADLQPGTVIINYSNDVLPLPAFQVKPCGLLSETGIRAQHIAIENGQAFPFFFAADGDHPFDILSAIFYLLSRYEEYLPHKKDEYSRYAD